MTLCGPRPPAVALPPLLRWLSLADAPDYPHCASGSPPLCRSLRSRLLVDGHLVSSILHPSQQAPLLPQPYPTTDVLREPGECAQAPLLELHKAKGAQEWRMHFLSG